MAKINLVIVNDDVFYLDQLKSYMLDNYSEKFSITCLSDKRILVDELKNINRKDLLLISKSLYESNMSGLEFRSTIILTEGNEIKEFDGHKVLNKYKPANLLCKEIIKIYSENTLKVIEMVKRENKDTKIITMFSPVGGSGKSILSAGLAMGLARMGHSVLYISLEDIQTTPFYFDVNNGNTFSDFLFSIKEKEENLSEVIDKIVQRDNSRVYFFNPTESILDIEDIDETDIRLIIDGISSTRMFSHIVIDTSTKYNSVYGILLKSSDFVITPIDNTLSAFNKLHVYLDEVGTSKKQIFVMNKATSESELDLKLQQRVFDIGIRLNIVINEDFELRSRSGQDILNSKVIRDGVEDIIKDLR